MWNKEYINYLHVLSVLINELKVPVFQLCFVTILVARIDLPSVLIPPSIENHLMCPSPCMYTYPLLIRPLEYYNYNYVYHLDND